MADPTITGTGAVKRAEFKLFSDVGEADTPEWELPGDRIEELSLEMNPNVETVTDVTGVTATTLDKYEEQTSVEPYYAKRESKLFAWLYSVVRDKKTLADVEKAVWEELETLKHTPVDEHELEKVKNRYESEQIFGNINYLNVATNLAYFEMLNRAEDINDEVRKYRSVSAGQLQRVAQQAFTTENSNTLYYKAQSK